MIAGGTIALGATLAFAAAPLVRLARIGGGDEAGGDLARALRRVDEAKRVEELSARAREGSWERRLADAALAARSSEERIAAVNDVLLELDHELGWGETWGRVAVRLSVGWGLMLACLGVAVNDLAVAGVALALGVVGALASGELGRRTRERVGRRRERVDEIVALVMGVGRGTNAGTAVRPARRRQR